MKLNIWFGILTFLVCFSVNAQEQTIDKNVYNPDADAKKEITLAVEKAKTDKKNVLIQIGGNWCAWCLKFNHLVTTDPELKELVNNNYEVVHVNYDKKVKNEAVLAELKHPERFGFPVFVVLDSNGNLVHTQNSAYLESKDGSVNHDPKLVKEFLQAWSYKALDPATYVN